MSKFLRAKAMKVECKQCGDKISPGFAMASHLRKHDRDVERLISSPAGRPLLDPVKAGR